jgi:hypothetical protein
MDRLAARRLIKQPAFDSHPFPRLNFIYYKNQFFELL